MPTVTNIGPSLLFNPGDILFPRAKKTKQLSCSLWLGQWAICVTNHQYKLWGHGLAFQAH